MSQWIAGRKDIYQSLERQEDKLCSGLIKNYLEFPKTVMSNYLAGKCPRNNNPFLTSYMLRLLKAHQRPYLKQLLKDNVGALSNFVTVCICHIKLLVPTYADSAMNSLFCYCEALPLTSRTYITIQAIS